MKKLLPLLLALIAIAGCGEKEENTGAAAKEEFTLLLDYVPNADHASIYAAQAAGYFDDVGLDLKIREPSDPAAPLAQASANRVDLAISYEPELLRARDLEKQVVSVGALVRKPLTSLISLPAAGIDGPEDLEGKTVGTAGIDYQSAYLKTILQQAGIPADRVKERDVGFGLTPALLTKKVDAVLGAFWNVEGVELERKKRNPKIIRIEQAGVPTYNELIFVANQRAVEEDPAKVRRFLAALALGTRDLERDPEVGVKALVKANPELKAPLQRAELDVTIPLFLPERGDPFGYQDPAEWARFTKWMRDNGLLENLTTPEGAFTNDLLPGRRP
ncbi:MAG: ABC transporter substrate-binding protein [Thermoleophilaceae bacterium]|nr:ABC transporter substrate-binding protein [Thermoleophilaceae bacterium]